MKRYQPIDALLVVAGGSMAYFFASLVTGGHPSGEFIGYSGSALGAWATLRKEGVRRDRRDESDSGAGDSDPSVPAKRRRRRRRRPAPAEDRGDGD